MKIKLTEKQTEFEGKLEKGKVTPFGTSAHIPFSKKHMGKIVHVIVPEKTKYAWLISPADRKDLFKMANKTITKLNSKLEHHRRGDLESLQEETFEIEPLVKTLKLLNKNNPLVKKIKKLYNLN